MSSKRLIGIVPLALGVSFAFHASAQPVVVPTTPVPIATPPPMVTTTTVKLGLPRPVRPLPLEPGLRIATQQGQPPVVGQHMLRTSAGAYRLYLKFAGGQQNWLTYATSADGVNFKPANKWLTDAPFLAGPRLTVHLINVTDGSMVAAYSKPAATGSQIDIALSKDGAKWQIVKSPALAGSGQADDGGPSDPTVLIEPGGLRMYYVRKLGGLDHVFSARSTDGYAWTAVPASCLTNAAQLGLASIGNPTVAIVAPSAYFMAFAATDAAGKKFVGMAVSTDGATFQYLGSVGQILDLSAYAAVSCPQMKMTATGSLRILLTVAKADGTGGVASATVPAAAVTCAPLR